MASLFVVRGRDQGKHIPLESRVTRVGRDSTCEVRLRDSEASRTHAELRPSGDGGFLVVDLDSSNGTLVNGERVTQRRLLSGDRIEIGATLLIYTGTGATSATAARTGHDVEIVAQPTGELLPARGDASRIISSVSSTGSYGPSISRMAPSAGGESRPESDRNLELMYLTALAVGRTDSIPELLNRVLRLVFDWVAADRGCVMLRDADSDRLIAAARCDRDVDGVPPKEKGRIAISRTILDYVIGRKEGVRTSDARDDARFDAAHSIVQGGIREALCVPLQGRYAVVGALYVDNYTSPGTIMQSGYQARFNDEQLRLMTAIGYQAALAIEDTYYYSAMLQSERLAAMGQTIATLSHHVKNILQGMRGGSYLIEAGLKRDDTDAVRRGWRIVERNQERISNLVMDMLTFSKEREPERVESDLNETVGDVVELMQSRAVEMEVDLQFVPAPELPHAWFDPDALHRAVLNIVTNAIDAAADQGEPAEPDDQKPTATPADRDFVAEAVVGDWAAADDVTVNRRGRVVVETQFAGDAGWTITVTDNGPGIAPEDREKIFSLFESKKGSRGTGLGLPVSDKILREHGGQIELVDSPMESATGRSGTRFLLRLPQIEADGGCGTSGDIPGPETGLGLDGAAEELADAPTIGDAGDPPPVGRERPR